MRCRSRRFREGSRDRSWSRESEKQRHKRDQVLKPPEVGHDYEDPSLQHTAAINCAACPSNLCGQLRNQLETSKIKSEFQRVSKCLLNKASAEKRKAERPLELRKLKINNVSATSLSAICSDVNRKI
jgi:hypothetical protein